MATVYQTVKNVMLLNPQNATHRAYCREKNQEKRINTAEKIQDPSADVTAWLELVVCTEFKNRLTIFPDNILRWETLNARNFVTRHYKQLDGVFNLKADSLIILEVKASQSKGSVSKGIKQLAETHRILRARYKSITSVLVAADCREFNENFGHTDESTITTMASKAGYRVDSDLENISSIERSQQYFYALDATAVMHLAATYGGPEITEDEYL
jgi:hypothetical protein